MDYIISSSQQVFENSADTQLFLISDEQENFLITFEGYLSTVTDPLDKFRCSEIIVYHGPTVLRIIETVKKRSDAEVSEDNNTYRKIELTDDLKILVVEWLFKAKMLSTM